MARPPPAGAGGNDDLAAVPCARGEPIRTGRFNHAPPHRPALAPGDGRSPAAKLCFPIRPSAEARISPLNLLNQPRDHRSPITLGRRPLPRQCRMLENVLDEIRREGRDRLRPAPGPVVTNVRTRACAGLKGSRVIRAADDIARPMSALSGARLPTLPGRVVIGDRTAEREAEMVVPGARCSPPATRRRQPAPARWRLARNRRRARIANLAKSPTS